jgi:hypothetical protein
MRQLKTLTKIYRVTSKAVSAEGGLKLARKAEQDRVNQRAYRDRKRVRVR